MNGPEELLRQALLDVDGYPVEGLSDEEKLSASDDTIEKADAAVVKTNQDLETDLFRKNLDIQL